MKSSIPYHTIFLLLTILFVPKVTEAQFTFGFNSALVLAQTEKDNLKGFSKAGIDVGLIGGYALKANRSILVEMKYSTFGSKRSGEELPPNSIKELAEIDLKSINVFFGYSFGMGDNWDGTQNFKFTGGLRIHRIIDSNINLYSKDELTTAEDPFKWTFVSMKFGPGFWINKNLSFDLLYEHSIFDLQFDSSLEQIEKLIPFNLHFSFSYYL